MTLCVSGIVRAVHQSSSKLGDTPLARLDLFESLPSRGFAVEPLQQTLQQNRALHRSTTQALRPAADVELYSSTALQSALHLSTQLYSALTTLYILYTLPQGRIRTAAFRPPKSLPLAPSPNPNALSLYIHTFCVRLTGGTAYPYELTSS